MLVSPTRSSLLSLSALLLGVLLGGLVQLRPDSPIHEAQAAPQIAIESTLEPALIRALAEGADFGPGIVDGPGNFGPTIFRVASATLVVGETYLTIQNLGETELLVIHHIGTGGSVQLGKVLIGGATTFVLDLNIADGIQVLGLNQGTQTRFAWCARVRDPA